MINTIKSQCFRGTNPEKITNEQLAAFCNVATALEINPLLPGMLYAYPSKDGAGIQPMIGPDGVYQILSRRPDVEGWDTTIETDQQGGLVAATANIYVKGKRPFTKRVFLHEWKMQSNPNWNSRPAHMLELRALKQCARQVIFGLPMDEDERKIIEVEATVTPARVIDGPVPTAPAPQSRSASLSDRLQSQRQQAAQPAVEPEQAEPPQPARKPPQSGRKRAAAPQEDTVAAICAREHCGRPIIDDAYDSPAGACCSAECVDVVRRSMPSLAPTCLVCGRPCNDPSIECDAGPCCSNACLATARESLSQAANEE